MIENSKDLRFKDLGQQYAHPASLDATAISPEAQHTVSKLTKQIIDSDLQAGRRQRSMRGDHLLKFERAVGAFLFELLKGASTSKTFGWFGVSLAAGSGSGHHVSDRHRRDIVNSLKAMDLIEVDPGSQFVTNNGEFGLSVRPGRNTRIKGSHHFFRLMAKAGINPGNFESHFLEALPKRTIYLKAEKVRSGGREEAGKQLPVVTDPHVEALEVEVQAINQFLAEFSLQEAQFRGYKRLFNQGDLPSFNWNKGGRLYADFQKLSAIDRHKITIDGSPTVELDVSSSYLTILHGIHDTPFDTGLDAYRSTRFERDVIKAYINQSLGSPKLATRWSKQWDEKFLEKHGHPLRGYIKPAVVREEVTATHPLLKDWGKLETTWADLMFIESEAMIYAIKALMHDHAAPSLVVHDSLIVREKDLEVARKAIQEGYKLRCGLVPKVRVKELNEVELKSLG
jgi:hypothetical protein